jgi:hypothetical protein
MLENINRHAKEKEAICAELSGQREVREVAASSKKQCAEMTTADILRVYKKLRRTMDEEIICYNQRIRQTSEHSALERIIIHLANNQLIDMVADHVIGKMFREESKQVIIFAEGARKQENRRTAVIRAEDRS